jgi:hypothetical protein
MLFQLEKIPEIINLTRFLKSFWILEESLSTLESLTHTCSVLAVDDRHVAFCEYNGSVARIICLAVATLIYR